MQQVAQREMLMKLSNNLNNLLQSSGKAKAAAQDEIKEAFVNFTEQIDTSNAYIITRTEQLRHCSSNPGANYYWILFVVMYGGIYFLGQ